MPPVGTWSMSCRERPPTPMTPMTNLLAGRRCASRPSTRAATTIGAAIAGPADNRMRRNRGANGELRSLIVPGMSSLPAGTTPTDPARKMLRNQRLLPWFCNSIEPLAGSGLPGSQ